MPVHPVFGNHRFHGHFIDYLMQHECHKELPGNALILLQ